jgi:hypothetical protein
MLTLFIIWLILAIFVRADNEDCPSKARLISTEVIESNADLYIGSLVNLRSSGSKGIFGCGNVTKKGLIEFETIKWIISTINQENGSINDKNVIDSFIPGLKLGL